MKKYAISNWIESSGGPLVVMDEKKAAHWNRSGELLDFYLSCQSDDYASRLFIHETDVLVLGDEPLRTSVAASLNQQLIVRWRWADSEEDVQRAIEEIDINAVDIIEKLRVNWISQHVVIFDAADTFNFKQCLRFSVHNGINKVSTFIYQPNLRTSLLVHSIAAA